ncbi:hypothetical protein V5O48_008501 [Marasmius crinis-equi]|uniref:UBA domain-containing protein n=1 Tax=Marasmius crinis-equi TaxID=585013 RepID=A0ABR3FDT3_9AGAR
MSNDQSRHPYHRENYQSTNSAGYGPSRHSNTPSYSSSAPSYHSSTSPYPTNGPPYLTHAPHPYTPSVHSGYGPDNQLYHPAYAGASELHIHEDRDGDVFRGSAKVGWSSRDTYSYQNSHTMRPYPQSSHQAPPIRQQHSSSSGSGQVVHHYRGGRGNVYEGETSINRVSQDTHTNLVQGLPIHTAGGLQRDPRASEPRRKTSAKRLPELSNATGAEALQILVNEGFSRDEAKWALTEYDTPALAYQALLARRKASQSQVAQYD